MPKKNKGIVSEILKQKLRETPVSEAQKVKRTSIVLPMQLYRVIKAYAAVEGRKMNELMTELLRESLKARLADKDLQKELQL